LSVVVTATPKPAAHRTEDVPVDFTAPANLHLAWLSALDFLRLNATRVWTHLMDSGVGFTLPAAAAALTSNEARARHLAAAERRRLGGAALYHLNEEATAAALATDLVPCDIAGIVPAPAGMVMWATPPCTTGTGVPIVAASWGEAEDGGLWITWWSDNAAAAIQLGDDADALIQVNGYLGYDRETHIVPRSWPAQADDPAHPLHDCYRAVISTWAAMGSGSVSVTADLVAPKPLRKQASRMDLTIPPVHCVGAPAPSGVDMHLGSETEAQDEAFARIRDGELDRQYRWIPELYRATARRLHTLEQQLENRVPGMVELLLQSAADRGDWPSWCWMPISRILELLAERFPPAGSIIDLLEHSRLAAVLAAVGSWRASGRPLVNIHDQLIPRFEAAADTLPRDLPSRWVVPCIYVTSETPGGAAGLFVHLEWDAAERRTELRFLLDHDPVGGLDSLQVQPVHLTGQTVRDALAATWAATAMRANVLAGSDAVPVTGPGTAFGDTVDRQASHLGVFVAIADFAASDSVLFTDARVVLGRGDARTWPPTPDTEQAPQLWLAADRAMSS
jgi:hypothetical protein